MFEWGTVDEVRGVGLPGHLKEAMREFWALSDMICLACNYAIHSLKGAKTEQGHLAMIQTRDYDGLDLGGDSGGRKKLSYPWYILKITDRKW